MTTPLSQDSLERTIEVLKRYNGNKTHAAKELGISRAALSKRLRKLAFPTVQAPGTPKLQETDTTTKNARTITLPSTRIHTVEQLIEACKIDLEVWYVDEFSVRKWEMGFIESEHKIVGSKGAEGEQVVDKKNEAGYEQLYAVSAKLKRVVTEKDNDGYVKDNVRLMKESKRAQFQLAAERRYRTAIITQTAQLDEMVAQIRDISHSLGEIPTNYFSNIPTVTPAFKPAVSEVHTEDAVLLLSDLHLGDVIRSSDTSGFPEFDLAIAGNRLGYTIEKVRQILSIQRAAYPIKKLYIWFGGDMGNGDLHDSPASNALFIGPQVHFTFKMLVMAVNELASLTIPDDVTGVRVVEEIVLLFTCGNHMRESTCKFMPMKYQAQRTFDWLIYQLLIDKFEGTPRIAIRQGMSPYIFEEIRGHRHVFAHGMQVGYKNSPDRQCKSMNDFIDKVRALFDSPEWRRKNGLQGPTFARACIGDIHVPVCFPRLISNGSLNGQNELGVNWTLEPIPCVQQLFGVTEKHLQTFHYEVNSSHVQRDQGDWNAYGHFAAEYDRQNGRK